jgi:hypothetical protein
VYGELDDCLKSRRVVDRYNEHVGAAARGKDDLGDLPVGAILDQWSGRAENEEGMHHGSRDARFLRWC